jgi:hypothetical protein
MVKKYSGTLKGMGQGIGQSHTSPQRMNQWGQIRGGRTKGVYLLRTLVDVGDSRIPKLKVTYYQDALLTEAIGHDVTLVLAQGSGLFSMQTPSGVVKPNMAGLIAKIIWQTIVLFVGGAFMFGVFLIFVVLFRAIFGEGVGGSLFVLDIAFLVFMSVLLPIYAIVDAARCWKATPHGGSSLQQPANWAPPTA